MAYYGTVDPFSNSMHKFGNITPVMDSCLCQLGRGSHLGPALRIEATGLSLGSSSAGAVGRSGSQILDGEFDPGSGRTLAACLTHASRTRSMRLAADDLVANGCVTREEPAPVSGITDG